jgi:predicted carbohydrate-binding protein with CBM48
MIPNVIPVTFHLPSTRVPTARRVSVLGSFNAWDPQVHRLRKSPRGDWAITVYLPTSRIVYCFDVDGIAWLDPEDDGRVPNGWGSEYSVRYVKPPDAVTTGKSVRQRRQLPAP